MIPKIKIKDSDLHSHIKLRMKQRGISVEEIEATINKGELLSRNFLVA